MPPRLSLLTAATKAVRQPYYQPIAPFLYPFLSQQRSASILSSLSDTPGSYHNRKRLGRGPSSGKGKTSGRGHKGQKQHGKVPAGFNGGQTPEEIVHGIRGQPDFAFSTEMSPINLNRIQYWINQGRLDPTHPITLKELNASKCIHGVNDGVKLLARGKEELTTPINLIVSKASAEAISAVEKLGGSVTTRYYTKFAIKNIKQGKMDPVHSLQSRIQLAPTTSEAAEAVAEDVDYDIGRYQYRLPDPTSRKDLEYYRDSAKRGYLSHMVEEGHGPSLFFKTPGTGRVHRKMVGKKGGKTATRGENRLW